jgi:anti-sigma B factor antagonist
MSSAGLRTLLTVYRQTQSSGVLLALIGLRPEIADTMKVTGFYQYFTVYEKTVDLPVTA